MNTTPRVIFFLLSFFIQYQNVHHNITTLYKSDVIKDDLVFDRLNPCIFSLVTLTVLQMKYIFQRGSKTMILTINIWKEKEQKKISLII